MKLIALAPAFLLLAACSPKSDHLAAITCVENNDYVLHSSIGGVKENEEKKYTETNHYLLNYETRQVKRWINKEGAPLVARSGVRFAPDFISWKYDGDPVYPEDVTENKMVLNRETLEISGAYQVKSMIQGAGGYFVIIALTGQCKKSEIPWEMLKPKKI